MLQHPCNQSPSIQKKTEVTVDKYFTSVGKKETNVKPKTFCICMKLCNSQMKFQVPSLCNPPAREFWGDSFRVLVHLHRISPLSFRSKEHKRVSDPPSDPSSLLEVLRGCLHRVPLNFQEGKNLLPSVHAQPGGSAWCL